MSFDPHSKIGWFQGGNPFRSLAPFQQTLKVSQHTLGKNLGFALGSINFCFQALVEKGFQDAELSQSKNKLRYAYLLTPDRVAKKSNLTVEFFRRKVAEYETLPK